MKHSFRETNLELQFRIKSKTLMSWSSRKKKESIFCTVYFVGRKFFQHFWFISIGSVFSKLSKYTHFFISKRFTWYSFLLAFKIVERLRSILKSGARRTLTQLHSYEVKSKENWFSYFIVLETKPLW